MPQTSKYIVRWYRFTVPATGEPDLVLHLENAVNRADLYHSRPDGSFGIVRFGMDVPFSQRSYKVPWPTVRLTPDMRNGRPLFLRAYGPTTTLTLEADAQYSAFRSNLARGTLFFVGFIASLGILSVFFAFYLRDTPFGYHALLMLTAATYMLTINGLSWEYLWPWASVDSNQALDSVFLVYVLALLLFTRRFLAVRDIRWLDVAIWLTFGLNVITTLVLDRLFPDSALLEVVQPLLNFAPAILILVAAVLRLRSGFPQVRFFAVGFGGMLVILTVAGLLHDYSQSRWGFNLGVAFDSLFFQFAVADRILSANSERDVAQRKELQVQDELVRTQQQAIEVLRKHNEAFNRFVPSQFLRQLGHQEAVDVRLGDRIEREMAVLFSDIRSFTALSEQMTPQDSFEFVNAFFGRVGPAIRRHEGFIDKYIGDAVMALFDSPDNAIDGAIALQEEVRRFNELRARALKAPIRVGVGIHYGALMLGTIGDEERIETTVISETVNAASRLEDLTAKCGAQIVVSGEVLGAVTDKAKYRIRPLGSIQMKGISRPIEVFEICDADEPEILLQKMANLETFEAALSAYAVGDLAASEDLFGKIVASNVKDLPAQYWHSRSAGLER